MGILNTAALLITLAALFSYLNYRFVRLPNTIGIMIISLLMSVVLLLLGKLGWTDLIFYTNKVLRSIDFHETLMKGMLSFLLFAGALHVNLNDLRQQKGVIIILATVGVLMSTFLIGSLSWLVLRALNIHFEFVYCLLFGALISPTDPIAVLGILKRARVPKSLETKISGESLFNDGMGVVVFLVLYALATGGDMSTADISLLLAEEIIGGIVFGLALGAGVYYLLKDVDNYQLEVLLTLALVMGGYALAHTLHISGPLAVVVAGLFIGNHGRMLAMSEKTRAHLDTFWELIDEILNAVLFVLIGLEVLLLAIRSEYFLAALAIMPLVLFARFVSVGLPILAMSRFRQFTPGVIQVMTWGGLRGGISVALALSLPFGTERDVILAITYAVVIFSIIIQGLTISRLVDEIR
ncbi:MAG: sodium:proton antiporter [Gammaproteobacteria bacterium]|nr:sodium:proton antiporter [Gammaproteobacteria bacterium]